MKYLITGGSGRLGTEFKKHFKGHYPTHKEFDIANFASTDWDFIIHMAGFTDVERAESEKFQCFKTNVFGTYNLLTHFSDKPFVFISTEQINAEGIYAQSKLIGELLVRNLAKNYLIIRTLFKPNPWPSEYAFIDQMTHGDYVNVIAPLIAKKIKQWDGKPEIAYVGTGRKTMFDLAKQTKPDVKPNSINDIPIKKPKDYLPNRRINMPIMAYLINRKESKRSLIYYAHWKKGICETLRSIYDDIHDYPDKKLKKKITDKLVEAMLMATRMQTRLAYLRDTYNDMSGSQGDYLKLIPEYKQNKLRRKARIKK